MILNEEKLFEFCFKLLKNNVKNFWEVITEYNASLFNQLVKDPNLSSISPEISPEIQANNLTFQLLFKVFLNKGFNVRIYHISSLKNSLLKYLMILNPKRYENHEIIQGKKLLNKIINGNYDYEKLSTRQLKYLILNIYKLFKLDLIIKEQSIMDDLNILVIISDDIIENIIDDNKLSSLNKLKTLIKSNSGKLIGYYHYYQFNQFIYDFGTTISKIIQSDQSETKIVNLFISDYAAENYFPPNTIIISEPNFKIKRIEGYLVRQLKLILQTMINQQKNNQIFSKVSKVSNNKKEQQQKLLKNVLKWDIHRKIDWNVEREYLDLSKFSLEELIILSIVFYDYKYTYNVVNKYVK